MRKTQFWSILFIMLAAGCESQPLRTVPYVDLYKYCGKWYEIARFDYMFERGLNNTTAEYSTNDDGSIKVINKGYNTKADLLPLLHFELLLIFKKNRAD